MTHKGYLADQAWLSWLSCWQFIEEVNNGPLAIPQVSIGHCGRGAGTEDVAVRCQILYCSELHAKIQIQLLEENAVVECVEYSRRTQK